MRILEEIVKDEGLSREEFNKKLPEFLFTIHAKEILKLSFSHLWLLRYYMSHNPCTKSNSTICEELNIERRTYREYKEALKKYITEYQNPGNTTTIEVNYLTILSEFEPFLTTSTTGKVSWNNAPTVAEKRTPSDKIDAPTVAEKRTGGVAEKRTGGVAEKRTPIYYSYLQNISTTTTGPSRRRDFFEIPENLKRIGLTEDDLKSSTISNKHTDDKINQFLQYIDFDIQHNKKLDSIKKDPRKYFLHILRSGPYDRPTNFITLDDLFEKFIDEMPVEEKQKYDLQENSNDLKDWREYYAKELYEEDFKNHLLTTKGNLR